MARVEGTTMRLWLLAAAATPATRQARFPNDEPLDDGGQRSAAALAGALPDPQAVHRGASRACRETLAAVLPGRSPVGLAPAGPDPGAWAGLMPGEVSPELLQAWLTDPAAAPPGGESLATLHQRVAGWLDALADDGRHLVLAVVDPPVVRAAVAHALGAGPAGAWRVDVAPLGLARLSGRAGRWNLQGLSDAARGTCP